MLFRDGYWLAGYKREEDIAKVTRKCSICGQVTEQLQICQKPVCNECLQKQVDKILE